MVWGVLTAEWHSDCTLWACQDIGDPFKVYRGLVNFEMLSILPAVLTHRKDQMKEHQVEARAKLPLRGLSPQARAKLPLRGFGP